MKEQVKSVKRKISEERQMDRDIRECMRCHYFWGNDNRCVNSNCIKKEPAKKKVQNECTDCPYKQNEGYCFPCMKKLLGKG